MKKAAPYVASLLFVATIAPAAFAQEKPKAELQTTPIKLQIVFSEFEAEKKVKSLPYSVYVNAANADEFKPGWVKVRIGSRVPVYVGKGDMQYVDVGTNVDARGSYNSDQRLLLQLTLERTWVEGEVPIPVIKSDGAQPDSSGALFREPILRGFKSELDLKLRENQPIESTMATDPISGKVLKAEISFSVVK
jgi:hypothetical protein